MDLSPRGRRAAGRGARTAGGSALLVLFLVPLCHPRGSPADPVRAHYTGKQLLVVEGPQDEVQRATEALSTDRTALAPEGARPEVLFDTRAAAGDDCPDPAAFVGPSAPIRRVLMLPTPAAGMRGEQSPAQAWNDAYRSIGLGGGAAQPDPALRALTAGNVRLTAVEPDFVWIDDELDGALAATAAEAGALAAAATHEVTRGADGAWPSQHPLDWHLQAAQLERARRMVEDRLPQQQERVTIAHFDTGFSPCTDNGLPPRLDRDHSWDFTRLDCDPQGCSPAKGGVDRSGTGLLKSRGHGTGTLSILAGGRVQLVSDGRPTFDGQLGGAAFANVLEYRLADFVAVWHPSVVASALRWAATHDVDVVSMSMGGPPNFTLHQAVNDAYCRGVAMFTAAGNNFRLGLFSFSTPRTTVFPARYRRVIAVGGVTADGLTYARRPWRWEYLLRPWKTVMQGNVGPDWVMDETIVAWTPNVPWLVFRGAGDCGAAPAVRLDGAGTSAATPQVAGAAAQWLQYHSGDPFLRSHWRSWQKTEGVYRGLIEAADRTTPSPDYNIHWFGAGILRAATAMENGVPSDVTPRPHARLGWDWIASILLGDHGRALVPGATDAGAAQFAAADNMLRTEISQLTVSSAAVAEVLDPLDPDKGVADEAARRRVLEVLAEDPLASEFLRSLAREQIAEREEE